MWQIAKSLILGNLRPFLLGLTAVAAVVYVITLQSTVSSLHTDLAAAQSDLTESARVNDANAQALRDLSAEYRNSMAAVRHRAAQAQTAAAAIAKLKAEAAHATPTPKDCATVGPHMRIALDGLRGLHSRTTNPNPSPAGHHPGQPVDLRPTAATPGDQYRPGGGGLSADPVGNGGRLPPHR